MNCILNLKSPFGLPGCWQGAQIQWEQPVVCESKMVERHSQLGQSEELAENAKDMQKLMGVLLLYCQLWEELQS